MAPHLTGKEKDFLRDLVGKGLELVQIHAKLEARRARSGTVAPALNTDPPVTYPPVTIPVTYPSPIRHLSADPPFGAILWL